MHFPSSLYFLLPFPYLLLLLLPPLLLQSLSWPGLLISLELGKVGIQQILAVRNGTFLVCLGPGKVDYKSLPLSYIYLIFKVVEQLHMRISQGRMGLAGGGGEVISLATRLLNAL